MGLDNYVCDELPWAMRETLRASGQDELSLLGWCIGGTIVAMHAALEPDGPARNLVLLTTPVDTSGSLYGNWVGRDSFDPEFVTEVLPVGAGRRHRLGQQDDEAGHQLLDDLPHAVAERAQGRGEPRGVPVDGALGGRQPAVPGPRLYPVDHLDVQGEPARHRRPAAARPARRPAPDRAERARGHRRRRPHRTPPRHAAAARHGRQRGRDASRSPGRPHRPDGRLEGAQGDLARTSPSGSKAAPRHEAVRHQRPRPARLPLQLQRGPGLLGPRDPGAAGSGGQARLRGQGADRHRDPRARRVGRV